MCDYEMPEAYSETQRTARKEHRCCECGRTISPRETYSYVSGIWEGEPQSFKTCADCVEVRANGGGEDSDGCPAALGELYSEWPDPLPAHHPRAAQQV